LEIFRQNHQFGGSCFDEKSPRNFSWNLFKSFKKSVYSQKLLIINQSIDCKRLTTVSVNDTDCSPLAKGYQRRWSQNTSSNWSQNTNAKWSTTQTALHWPKDTSSDWPEDTNAEWSQNTNADWSQNTNADWPEDTSSNWSQDTNAKILILTGTIE
jgi:hypothetical protein